MMMIRHKMRMQTTIAAIDEPDKPDDVSTMGSETSVIFDKRYQQAK